MNAHNRQRGFLIAASMAVAISVLSLTTPGIPGGQANAAPVGKTKKGTSHMASQVSIVLVHGAFADGSGWSTVIPLLEKEGYTVTAVQNPLTSLADDIATTKRVIDAQKGPVVVVGHSYGGVVITGAAAGNPNVKALVYVAAFAPDSGESIGAVGSKYPATPLSTAVAPDAAGFLSIDRAKFHDVFCPDVPDQEALIMSVIQRPLSNAVFGQAQSVAAWRTIPSWYVVAK